MVVLKVLRSQSWFGHDLEQDHARVEDIPSSKTKETKELFKLLQGVFPENFKPKDSLLPYYEVPLSNNNTPLLNVDPLIKHSWFDTPKKDSSTDSVGYWPSSIRLPPKSPSPYPPNYPLKPPNRPTDLHICDPGLKKLLEHPRFSSPLHLDSSAFQRSDIDVTSLIEPRLDVLLRSSLFDNFVTDEFLAILLKLVPLVKEELDPTKDISPHFDLVRVIRQAAQSNARAVQSTSASHVANIVHLRDHVLYKFDTPANTKEILRGSSFLSDKLFGPLPESLEANLRSLQGKDVRCSKKDFFLHFFFFQATLSFSGCASRKTGEEAPVLSETCGHLLSLFVSLSIRVLCP